ncbi:PilZ domain-containing protein [Hyphomonas sp.]|uniref:PilZ domain-containing protein n=1 Tax=Hyphomonas sp. TaxID=87 RepID=UPI00391AD9E8
MSGSSPESPRQHTRQRTLKGARMVFNDGKSSFDVLIRDLSEGGAKLKLGSASWTAPDTFDLIIPNPNTGVPTKHHCEKRWQRSDLVGARFIEPQLNRPPAIPAAISAPNLTTRS